MQYHDAGIRGIGHDTVGLVNFDDGNAAGGNRHGLPRPLKALAIIDIAVSAGAGEACLGGNLDGQVAVEKGSIMFTSFRSAVAASRA